jgi:AsmA protein
VASFDPDSLKPRIAAAVKQATGRELTLQGRIELGLSLQPTLIVRDLSLANPPGFSRPQMATVDEMDLKLAAIPLLSHRIVIDWLVLRKPDILLETDRQGRPNWGFAKQADPVAQEPVTAGSRSQSSPSISAADVRIEQGRLAWREDATGRSTVIDVTTLRSLAVGPSANLHLTASAKYHGAPFTLTGDFGSLADLRDPTGPWPVHTQLEAAGARLTVDGTIAQPLHGRGYAVKLAAAIPNLAVLAPFLSRPSLPPLHDVSLAMQLVDTGEAMPAISDISLHVSASDLGETAAGLKLDALDIAASRLDQPVHVAAHGSFGQSPATLDGSFGVPAGIMTGAGSRASVPIDLSLQALGSNLAIKGNAGFGANAPPSVQAEIRSDVIDADALAAAFVTPSNRASAAPGQSPTKPAPKDQMIPNTALPFDLLHLADADLKLNIAQLKSAGEQYRAIAAHAELHGGKLQLDPIEANLPEGHLDALLNADATGATPAVALRLRSPAIALQRVFAVLREPTYISGNLDVEAELHGAGATPHAIASSVDGSLALSMANGTLDNRALGSRLGSVLREVNLLDLVGRGGTSQIHCFVARLNASHGIVTVRPLVLASSLLTLDGDGSLNLGTETLDLRVRPQARVAGTGLVVPVRVSGSFRSPSASPDPAATVAQNAGTMAGAVLGSATPLGLAAGALGAKQLLGGSESDCAAAFAAARGASGAAASAKRGGSSESQQRNKPPNVGDALKQLFR